MTAEREERVSFSRGREKVLAVHASFGRSSVQPGAAEEMDALVQSAGGAVIARLFQHRHAPDPSSFVGSGKVVEIKAAAEANGITTIVFDSDLGPGQASRLEEATGCKVIDRTELILTIFALHARTAEALLQIELAQLRYALPRLTGMWHHLSRLGGGIGTRGPGETQLEVDRRKARQRIKLLETRIDEVEERRVLRSSARRGAFQVALTGYTNTGKSSLLNALCGSGVHAEDKLFATLDAVTRRLHSDGAGQIVLSDTVGFIDRLPEELIASFRSTLGVVRDADLLILVGDLSNPWRERQMQLVRSTLDDIGAGSIPRILVWNKSDLADPATPMEGIVTSALTGCGIAGLAEAVIKARNDSLSRFELLVEGDDGLLQNWLYENCAISSRTVAEGAQTISGGCMHGLDRLRARLAESTVAWQLHPLSDTNGNPEWTKAQETR